MMFVLGVITGLLISLLILIISVYLIGSRGKDYISTIVENTERRFRPTGAIFEPQSDQDEAREMIIQKNREAGLDTKISELE